MSAPHLGQRIALGDLHLQRGIENARKHGLGAGAHGLARGDIAKQRGAGDKQRTALRQLLQVQGRWAARGVAEADHQPPRRQAIQRLKKRRRAHTVIHHRQQAALGEFAHTLDPIVRAAQKTVRVAALQGQFALGFGAHRTDKLGAERGGPLTEQQPHATCGGVKQGLLTRAQREQAAQQILDGGPLQEHGRGRVEINLVGDGHHALGGQHNGFSVSADAGHAVRHAISHGKLRARTDRLDHAGALQTETARQRQGI